MSIYTKIFEVQKRMKPILKEEINPHFKSKFFDINGLIEELKPVLNEVGLVVIQPLIMLEGKYAITTRVVDSENGESIESTIVLPDTPDAPKMGAAVTYLRRFSLTSLFLLQGEDDDGGKPETPAFVGAFLALQEAKTPEQKAIVLKRIEESTLLTPEQKKALNNLFREQEKNNK